MSDSLQPLDHTLPDNIDKSISDFKKKIIFDKAKDLFTGLSQIVKKQPDLLFMLHQSCEAQIKNTLELPERKFLGIKFNKKLAAYDHDTIISSCKQKLIGAGLSPTPEGLTIDIRKIINDLSMYLSGTGRCISRQDFDEIQEILATKKTKFSIKTFNPELFDNIDKNTYSTEDRGKKRFPLRIDLPEIFTTRKYNNENIVTLEQISKAYIKEGKITFLPGIDKIPETEKEVNDIQAMWKYISKNESKKFKGYYSIGGKIHFGKSIPKEKVEEFRNKFGFESTGFKLIHANTSLLLPPSCSPNILLFYILALQKTGLIDGDSDLQLSIPGRLPNRAAGILGSATLLSGDTHTEYDPEAFSTTHDNCTGAKIMAYDGGVLNNKFKSNSSYLRGRTDMLGVVDLNSTYTYHFLGSIISQTFYGGKYAKTGKAFMNEYLQLLKKHNLQWILNEERVYDDTSKNTPASSEQHYTLIKTITDLQEDNRESFLKTDNKDGLIVFELKNLLNTYQKKLNYKK